MIEVWLKSNTFIFLELNIYMFVSYLHRFKVSYSNSGSSLTIYDNFPVIGEEFKLTVLTFGHLIIWADNRNLHPLKLTYSS